MIAARMLIGAWLVELRGRPNTPCYTPTEVTDLLLDLWLLMDEEGEWTEADLEIPAEVAAASAKGFMGMFETAEP